MKKFYASLAALTIMVSGVLLLNFMGGVSKALPTDCDSNSVIYCGATSSSSLASKYKANKTGDLDNIYHAYGLTDDDMTHASTRAKMGAVHKDGRVTVGSETVATNAKTIGRHNMSGSHKKVIGGKTYYERTPSVSFGSESIVAFIFFDANGEFKAAVITSCGNPVIAVAKKKPVYACDGLGAVDLTRTEYRFTARASAKNGASITGYNFDFGDGTKKTQSSNVISHNFVKEGNYTIKVTANIKVGSTTKVASSDKCQMHITIAPQPETPMYACDGLESTKISRTDYSFDGTASASGGATITGYTFDFGDGSKKTVTNPSGVTHTYTAAGTYTARLSVTVKVENETKTVTSEDCTSEITIAEAPAYTCDGLESTKISRTEYSFDGAATATGGAEIVGYTFDFGDGKQQAATNPSGVQHTYDKDGVYKITMSVTVKVDGQTKTVTSEHCATEVTVTPPNKVEVCNPETGEIIIVDEKDQDKYKPVGDIACTPVKVCNPETGEIITVKPSEADKYKPIGDIACQPKQEECKPGIPVGDKRCTPSEECKPGVPMGSKECAPCEIPGKENLPKDSTECVETPVELPHTGTGSLIGSTVGIGSIITALGYYIASRRGLLSELLNR